MPCTSENILIMEDGNGFIVRFNIRDSCEQFCEYNELWTPVGSPGRISINGRNY